MMILENLYPGRVFYYFEQIAGIPHGSGNTRAISNYLVNFAKAHSLKYRQDEKNNVIIFKDATPGYEAAEPVIIQGHMDMVCEKEQGVEIDFEKDGLALEIADGYVCAKGTTLGGDDGIAIAYALALLESKDLAHPRLEVVVTVDEEIGMFGAMDIDLSVLKGRRMLNIDSEEEGHFLTSCAGGIAVHAKLPVNRVTKKGVLLRLAVTGLVGGHSGAEIHRERGNANILMGRFLCALGRQTSMGICSLAGGQKDNAIPRECTAEIIVEQNEVLLVKRVAQQMQEIFRQELAVSDKEAVMVCVEAGSAEAAALDQDSAGRVIAYLRMVPNGVQSRCQAMPQMVETSLNLGILELTADSLNMVTSIRSSVRTRKEELLERVGTLVGLLGGTYETTGDYPAWEYLQESQLRDRISRVYEDIYGEPPVFESIHAGLECGIFSEKLPGLDCVSFGPDIEDIHTPKERLNIASVGRVWDFLVDFLRQEK